MRLHLSLARWPSRLSRRSRDPPKSADVATLHRTDRDRTTGAASASAVPQLPRVIADPQRQSFKLSGSDFKNFFSADTARTLAYTSIVAIGSAPWDREGVNNGFNIPTTVFQSGNVIGSFVFQVGAGVATYGVGKSSATRRPPTLAATSSARRSCRR